MMRSVQKRLDYRRTIIISILPVVVVVLYYYALSAVVVTTVTAFQLRRCCQCNKREIVNVPSIQQQQQLFLSSVTNINSNSGGSSSNDIEKNIKALLIKGDVVNDDISNENIGTSTTTTNHPSPITSATTAVTATATIQILMSDTGGGHRASANAIRDALTTLYPNNNNNNTIYCDIVDIYTDYGTVFPYNSYVPIYQYMAGQYPIVWKVLYEFGTTPIGLWFNNIMLELFCTNSFTQCISRLQPYNNNNNNITTSQQQQQQYTPKRADMIVSVHPLTQDLPFKIVRQLDEQQQQLQQYKTKTPFVTVVTDLGSAHPTWFHPGVDKCFVPSEALYNAAIQRKLVPNQIVQYGLPIRKGFWGTSSSSSQDQVQQQQQKVDLRHHLGLNTSLPTILIVGGGDGMGGIIDVSKQFIYQLSSLLVSSSSSSSSSFSSSINIEQQLTSQIVIVCGKNQKAKLELEEMFGHTTRNDSSSTSSTSPTTTTTSSTSNVLVNVLGFVNNMDEYMKASDILVTKAGPGTIAEASICGLPCMMFSYLPGQEEGNIPYVENNGFGKYSSDPKILANMVYELLLSPERLLSMQQAAYAASRPNATMDIARDIGTILFQHIEERDGKAKNQ